MCNINALWKRNGKKVKDDVLAALLDATTGYSFLANNDGEGAYFDLKRKGGAGVVERSRFKLRYAHYLTCIKQSATVVTHQRISTSGHSIEYLHPFVSDDFALVHNGILPFANGDKSDTAVLFERLTAAFGSATGDREERLVSALRATLDGTSGSYSIVLCDRVTGHSYYCKDGSTNISFALLGEDVLYCTTATRNLELALSDDWTVKLLPIAAYRVYRIRNDDLSIVEVGRLEQGVPSWTVPSFHSRTLGPRDESSMTKKERKRQRREERSARGKGEAIDAVKKAELVECAQCGRPTSSLNYHPMLEAVVCGACIARFYQGGLQ